jgi:hypothetical protein
MPWRPHGCARNGIARRRRGGKHLANLKFDQEITALLVIDSGNHLVCGGAVQAAGGGLMALLGRGRRGLGAFETFHNSQHRYAKLGSRTPWEVHTTAKRQLLSPRFALHR